MTDAVRVGWLALIGSVVAAFITTMSTIWASHTELKKAQEQVKALQGNVQTVRLASIPVDTIVTSLLDPVQFAKEAGDPPTFDLSQSKWTLADGKIVSGTTYAALSANSPIPDLRGLFLRGKNNKRGDGHENPEGELALGQFQDDKFQEHMHDFNRGGQGGTEKLYAAPADRNTGLDRGQTNITS